MRNAWALSGLALGLWLLPACGSEAPDAGLRSETSRARTTRDAGKTRDSATHEEEESDEADEAPDAGPPALSTGDTEVCAGLRTEAPKKSKPVDVIWVIDNSPSMVDKALRVANNMASFFKAIEASGADTHIVTISALNLAGGSQLGKDKERYRFVLGNVWSKELYSAALAAAPRFRDFLRAEAPTHFVMVTDDNDVMAPATFKQKMESALGRSFIQHAIAWGGGVAPLGCAPAGVGSTYNQLAGDTNGRRISICSGDWNKVFSELQSAVVDSLPLPCSYDLAAAVTQASGDFDPNKVQVVHTPADGGADRQIPRARDAAQCGDRAAWYYDDAGDPRSIELCPAACKLVEGGGLMDIAFGCPAVTVI